MQAWIPVSCEQNIILLLHKYYVQFNQKKNVARVCIAALADITAILLFLFSHILQKESFDFREKVTETVIFFHTGL